MESPAAQPQKATAYHTIKLGTSPLVATAIHAGHNLRDNLLEKSNLSDQERLYEEDPYTDYWVSITDNQIISHYSRFEFDINRDRNQTVYREPEDAWGLVCWKEELSKELVNESLARYDEFYSDVKQMLDDIHKRHGCFVVYDIHSYNHKRYGPDGPDADKKKNPEINIGTGNMNREKFAPVVDALMKTMGSYNYFGRSLDVRENIKFTGGNFMRWIHRTFPDKVCVVALEFKKFFMDEWTGVPDQKQMDEIKKMLKTTTKPVLEALAKVAKKDKK